MSILKRFSLIVLMAFSMPAAAQIRSLVKFNTPKTISERWELDSAATHGTFLITPYKPIFILPAKWSAKPNEKPFSGNTNPDYEVPDGTNLNNVETEFQLSFKTKILQHMFWGQGDLWGAYTQKAYWQLYNESLSRPFREINYEPELILNFPVNFKIFGLRARMAGIAFNHQSNGKSLPYSRSWNRVIFHAAFDAGNWSVYIRPWLRLRTTKDDNPDINRYIGKGDVNVIYVYRENVFSFIGSSNFQFDQTLRGNANFSWAFPIYKNLKGHFQMCHGYGETLIDYNSVQTSVGLGVSLVEWL